MGLTAVSGKYIPVRHIDVDLLRKPFSRFPHLLDLELRRLIIRLSPCGTRRLLGLLLGNWLAFSFCLGIGLPERGRNRSCIVDES